MKKRFIFLMLISLFMVSPSYAQEKQKFDETQKKIIIYLLNPICTENIDSYVQDGKFNKKQAKEFKNIKQAIINQNLKYGEEKDVIEKYINGEISASDAIKEIKKIKPNKESPNSDIINQNNGSIAPTDTQTDTTLINNEQINEKEIIEQQKNEIARLRNDSLGMSNKINMLTEELTTIYTANFILKWDTIPFSQYKIGKDKDNRFVQEYQNIIKGHENINLPANIKQKPENFEQLPDNIQKIFNLYDDYLNYQKGDFLIRNQYDKNAVDSMTVVIKNIRNKSPQNTTKWNELDSLYNKLYDYQSSVETFQDLITKVNEKKEKIGKNQDWDLIILSPESNLVDPLDIDVINEIPWLKEMLPKYIKEIRQGKTEVENKIMNLLPKQPQQGEENNININEQYNFNNNGQYNFNNNRQNIIDNNGQTIIDNNIENNIDNNIDNNKGKGNRKKQKNN